MSGAGGAYYMMARRRELINREVSRVEEYLKAKEAFNLESSIELTKEYLDIIKKHTAKFKHVKNVENKYYIDLKEYETKVKEEKNEINAFYIFFVVVILILLMCCFAFALSVWFS